MPGNRKYMAKIHRAREPKVTKPLVIQLVLILGSLNMVQQFDGRELAHVWIDEFGALVFR
jgi:hypothetical protein